MPGVTPSHIERVIAAVLDASRPVRAVDLTELSDLDRSEIGLFKRKWAAVAAERRREVVSRMAELAEENFDLDFTSIFLGVLADPDAMVRTAAASGLVVSEEGHVVSPLVRLLLQDESEPVRIAAALSLGKFVLQGELDEAPPPRDAEQARTALLQVVENRSLSPELRRRALESLAAWSSPRVTELIANAYRSTEPGFKASAIYAMGMNCDGRWLPALFAEMKNSDAKIRYEAAHAAGEIAEAAAVPHLLPMLNDGDIEVRVAAIGALGQIGGKTARDALRRLAKEGDERLRESAEQALAEIAVGDDSISL